MKRAADIHHQAAVTQTPQNRREWHFADKPAAPDFVAYWRNNGQRSVLTLD